MAAHAMRGVALQSYLRSECRQCLARLCDLALSNVWRKPLDDRLDLCVSFDDPLESIDTAVALDPAHASECSLQPLKDLRDDPRFAALCG
ncbi:MAG: hypothetical protein ACRDF9_00690 [Candidatus Limnocylindria bacterium]